MKVTQKYKLEHYDALVRERDLYERYFWDQKKGVTYDISAEADGIKLFVFRLDAAHGGYVIADQGDQVPHLYYWDDFVSSMAHLLSHHDSTLPLRIAIERAGIAVARFRARQAA